MLIPKYQQTFINIHTVIFFSCRFIISFIYYGLTLHIGKLGGNLYVNFTVSCLMEFAGYLLCIFMDRTGRKPMHLTVMFLSGISCLASVLPLMFGDDCNFKSILFMRTITIMISLYLKSYEKHLSYCSVS